MKNITHIAFGSAALLLIPLVAMFFTDTVVWGLFDFILMFFLLFGAGTLIHHVSKQPMPFKHKTLFIIISILLLLLIWTDLAVGIFNMPRPGS